MADVSLGSAIVSITGDLEPLLKSFRDAKSARDAFQKDMVSSSQGMLAFSKAANDAGDNLSKADRGAKSAAASVDKLTDAQNKSAKAAKDAAAAIETEAQKNERLSKMIDASIAKMQERDRVTKTALASRTSGIQVPREIGLAERQTGIMAATTVGGALNAAKDVAAAKGAAAAIAKEAEAVETLGKKAHLSSSSIREMLVLAREAGRGDFTRMTGSASLLAQQLGVVEKLGGPLILTMGGIAGVVALVGTAMIEGAKDANLLANAISLSGNYAGLTSDSFHKMADGIADSTNTSISSNEKLISSLAKTNEFTSAQIKTLVTDAETLSKATGESAETIVADFAKMAEGPSKYASEFQRTHLSIISPIQLRAIQELEARGEKEKALELLIETVNQGIAKSTVEQTGYILRAWAAAGNAVSNFWEKLKRIGTDAGPSEQLAQINAKIQLLNKAQIKTSGNREAVADLERQRDAIQGQIVANDKNAKAQAASATETKKEGDAAEYLARNFGHVTDRQKQFRDDKAALDKSIREAGKDDPNAQVLRTAVGYAKAIEDLKKKDLPTEFKNEAKAAREAASEQKKAAELLKQRTQQISDIKDENAAYNDLLPLYRDQTLSLDEIAKRIEELTALRAHHTDATSKEGKAIVDETDKLHDNKKAVEDLKEARQALENVRKGNADTEAEIASVGKAAGAIEREKILIDAKSKSLHMGAEAQAEYLAEAQKLADIRAKDVEQLAHDKFIDSNAKGFDQQIQRMKLQAETMHMSASAAAAYTYEQEKLNDAINEHIMLSDSDKAKLHEEAAAVGVQTEALKKLNEEQTRQKFTMDTVENGLEDAIFSGNKLTSILGDMARAFAKAAFEAAVFGNGPLAGLFGMPTAGGGGGLFGGGGGGLLGGLFKTAGGLFGGGGGGGGGILDGLFGGSGGASGLFGGGGGGDAFGIDFSAMTFHSGTSSVRAGAGFKRDVPASTFVNAPRFHNGLRQGEFPAILEEGETVNPKWSNRNRGGGSVSINVFPKDYDSFRQSRRQIARQTKEALR